MRQVYGLSVVQSRNCLSFGQAGLAEVNYARWARQFADGELEHILGLYCADAERGLKSGEDKTTTNAKLIFTLCGVKCVDSKVEKKLDSRSPF